MVSSYTRYAYNLFGYVNNRLNLSESIRLIRWVILLYMFDK
ncbi:hypothetical protein TFKS16_2633 [Tannerella forsythia KS16]|nr:hypothetical protein TF3313_2556 [Tannerella forsythia 3313]BAR52816.1 hypothetical protein TFKS16_2633 [Tannerella forsythia KS16]